MIRSLAARDRESVLDLLRATGNFNDPELGLATELIDIVLGQPAQRDYHAFVDEVLESTTLAVVGFLLLGPTPATAGTWDLYWIAVHPRHQGTGLAQALDGFAERFVTAHGGYWLIAETSSQPSYQRTHAFYRKQQYQIVAHIPDYYRQCDDLIVYGKRLAAQVMDDTVVLHKHHLRHIPELKVSERILRCRFARGCSTSSCSGNCCRDGVLADIEEREQILRHADLVRRCMDSTQEQDTTKWFGDEIADPDFPSGRAVETQVHRGACVFLNGQSRCVLQKAELEAGPAFGALKPFFCRAFPVCIEYGVLTVNDEHCPDEHACCGPVQNGELTIFDVCGVELEYVLGPAGLNELRELSTSERSPSGDQATMRPRQWLPMTINIKPST